jgi:hypothetical protein
MKITPKSWLGVGLMVAGSICSSAALAGDAMSYAVTITNFGASSSAMGQLNTARYSSDSYQYIGCSITISTSTYVQCAAQDANGNYLSCTTTNAGYVAVAQAINETSLVAFGVSSGGSTCSDLFVDNASYNLH